MPDDFPGAPNGGKIIPCGGWACLPTQNNTKEKARRIGSILFLIYHTPKKAKYRRKVPFGAARGEGAFFNDAPKGGRTRPIPAAREAKILA
jgi:hypothetical protein